MASHETVAPESRDSTARMREFAFDDRDFEAIRTLVKATTGINLTLQKRELVYGRLAVRLRALGVRTFREYRQIVAGDPEEQVHLCNAITTNLTSFFREPHHFEHLRDQFLPPHLDRMAQRRLRLWSAGCSTGEEAYSIAMILLESMPNAAERDVRILATDVDSDVLATAAAGRYPAERMKGVSDGRVRRFFAEQRERNRSCFVVRPEVRQLVTFQAAEPNAATADVRSAGCDFLPQHRDLLRQGHATRPVLQNRAAAASG